jgi:hypothetical protein
MRKVWTLALLIVLGCDDDKSKSTGSAGTSSGRAGSAESFGSADSSGGPSAPFDIHKANAGSCVCSQDADCRTFSDYCTGCDCRALGKHDPDPVCNGPGWNCAVDPCSQTIAVCRDGTCQLSPSPEAAPAGNCIYYSDATKTMVVGKFGKDCCNNSFAWGVESLYYECSPHCMTCVPPPP